MKSLYKSILAAAALLLTCSCLSEDALKRSYEEVTPLAMDDDWVISTPEAEGMNTDMLEEAFAKVYYQDAHPGARALLVIKNGKLVAEAYPGNDNHATQLNNVQSITKSFVSVLTGIAVDRGDLGSIDTPLFQIYPSYFDNNQNKRSITIEHALTMNTGLDFDDSKFLDFYNHEGNSAEYALSQPLWTPPGTEFHYSDADPQLIVSAIEQSIDQTLDSYINQHLLAPLGITNYQWETTKDGTHFGAFGLFLTPRDLARFGQLLLNDGMWNGQQIVSSAWLQQATRIHPELVGGGGQYFGYYFWLNPANSSYAARGNGGQFVYIVPDKELVIVYTASPSSSDVLNYEQGLINTIINSTYCTPGPSSGC